MAFEQILSETREHGVLLLTLNDPSTLNALNPQMTEELIGELDRFSADPELRCVVITGAGRGFCSGANVRAFNQQIEERAAEGDEPEPAPDPWMNLDPVFTRGQEQERMGPPIVHRLHTLRKPSIAAVNGAAYGLGCGIALYCDIRVAGASARFSEAFVRNGLIPADGSAWKLPQLIGQARTLWLQYTGEPIGAEEAERIGLVNVAVADEELLETALGMAERLARGPMVAMGMIKQLVMQGRGQSLPEHMALASRGQELARQTEDHREGVRAILEKRDPRFLGR